MIDIKIILIPLIGAIIGLGTNYLAIKMLFHPRKKVLGIQGVFSKRKKDIAKRVGEVSPIILPKFFDKIKEIPYMGNMLYSKLTEYFKTGIENKINSLSDDKIEEAVMKAAKKELNFIVWAGGIIGFLIGCIQVLIMLI